MRRHLFTFIMLGTLFMVPFLTFAQTQTELIREALQLSVSPQYPEANTPYTVTLESYAVQKTTISWFINGKEDTLQKNKNSLTNTAGNIGSKTVVTAVITTSNGTRVEKSVTIQPTRVDLHVTSNSVVPAFYKGRALPSSGTSIEVGAVVFTGLNTSPSNYLYVWKLDGQIQNGGAVRGKTLFSFIPSIKKNVVISVEVQNTVGKVLAQKSQNINIVQPELYFYEQNPLRGLSSVTLNNPYTFIADEMTIRAEGYFMDAKLQGANILNEWRINNRVVASTESDPQEIIVRKEGNSGTSKLSFHIRNLQQLLQGVEKSMTIRF